MREGGISMTGKDKATKKIQVCSAKMDFALFLY